MLETERKIDQMRAAETLFQIQNQVRALRPIVDLWTSSGAYEEINQKL